MSTDVTAPYKVSYHYQHLLSITTLREWYLMQHSDNMTLLVLVDTSQTNKHK